MKKMIEVFGHEYPEEMFGTCERCGGLGERDHHIGAYSICDEEPHECEVCGGLGLVFLENPEQPEERKRESDYAKT